MLPLLLLAAAAVAADPEPSLYGRALDLRAPLDCASAPCAAVLPAAARFEPVEDRPYVAGLDAGGEVAGWVVRSTDVTDRRGYSGKPIVTLIGIDPQGAITGAVVLGHSEPILLVGIPESKLTSFVAQYVGRPATAALHVGGHDADSVDAISGATVTMLSENATILEAARALGADVGVVHDLARVPGHFVSAAPWTWRQLVRKGALGHLVVTAEQMDEPRADRPFLDLWFGVADAPQVGIPLLGESTWRWNVDRLQPGEHLVVMLNGGTASFKGSGFVRGGVFDRIRIEQGLRTLIFRDMDYTALDQPPVSDAPPLWEGALFVARGDALDPGEPYRLEFLGSVYETSRGAFQREFRTFEATHTVPESVYVLDGPRPMELVVWRQAWASGWKKALAVGLYLLAIGAVFAGRRFTTAAMHRLERLHTSVLVTSFFGLGLLLHVQPSVTQLLTLVGSARGKWDWGLFLSDPVLFVSWIFIAVVTLVWGRGVFCGWTCPYGAFNELTFKLGRLLRLPAYELPDRIHLRLRHLRYGVFAVLLAVFLLDAQRGEQLAEIEPFKSTFFVPVYTRHAGLIAWWLVLVGASLVMYRPFCRYVCPMGAALAVASSARVSGPYRREFCSKCKICTRGCEPRAIRPDGTIDPRECLSCMECEANWRDDEVCPPLVRERRDRERGAAEWRRIS